MDLYSHPIIFPTYHKIFLVQNVTPQILYLLQPFCNKIYIDNYDLLYQCYIKMHQEETIQNLSNKIKNINNYEKQIGILVFLNGGIVEKKYKTIQMLNEIIYNRSEQIGEFVIQDNILIQINKIIKYNMK